MQTWLRLVITLCEGWCMCVQQYKLICRCSRQPEARRCQYKSFVGLEVSWLPACRGWVSEDEYTATPRLYVR